MGEMGGATGGGRVALVGGGIRVKQMDKGDSVSTAKSASKTVIED